ncbi:MAG TPA: A/G-specific adenine glycosylase [Bryobacteraceae bacterium]|nr:A/G-specific adenine glycosylase [Bryobacteraceae bacterium]
MADRGKNNKVFDSTSGFAAVLTDWYRRERRDLPWRGTDDPYCILVSEIMLQQTRAQTVIPYYERFLQRFPDLSALAEAREQEVLTYWGGLGYYSRARNLQRAARAIVAAGQFPTDYDGIRELPGVGPYTAAAVASIAFNGPHAVVDGNVLRIIARLSDDGADIALPKTRARFQQIANQWLDGRDPGQFNQAMMELGATVCLPRTPHCLLCPVAQFCEGRKAGRQHELPLKRKRAEPRHIQMQVAIIEKKGSVLLRRRPDGASLMAGFWELPAPGDLPSWCAHETLGSFRHTITHHHYTVTVLRGTVTRVPPGFRWRRNGLDRIPLTTVARKAIRLRTSS